ncbi:hypothetical protein EV356DRAFT_286306 [Viridothelium virens]|uniref:Uncharacterized protein n=1 Tax=Viridothelium virens TaxID=1048519 RepID=A0A6A6H0P3_VIRVR|nr:hypothetical protein EV356DRAFT_286306 [Viridothelium virens]
MFVRQWPGEESHLFLNRSFRLSFHSISMTSTVVVEQQTLDQKRKAAQASEDNPRTSHDQVYVYDGADSGYISKEASGSERVAPRTLYKFDKEIPREANERFLDLRDLFADPLFDYAFKSAKKEKHMSWQLKWLGEDENQMKPHIVVACHQKYKKKVKKYFEQAHVKCELQRPDAYIQPAIFVCEGPWILASVLRRNAFLAEPSSNTLCGLAITTSENDVLRQVATLGGIIACKNKDGTSHLWGLTVGHVFHTQEHGSDRSEASDSSEDSDDRTENEADGSDVEISPEILHGRLQAEVPRIRDLNLFKNSLSRENQKTISTSAMIKDPQSSETYRYYDWALVDLANIPNVADQLLNRVTYASELHQITKARNLKLDRETPSKDVAIGSRRVLILAASNDEGLSPLVGVVSLNPSFINLGIGGYPIMVLSLKLLEKSSRCT